MIVRHHEFERVVIVCAGRDNTVGTDATVRFVDKFVSVDQRLPSGGYERLWGALGEVVAWTPWWAHLRLSSAIAGSLVPSMLYAVVVHDGDVPEDWPEELRRRPR